MIFQSFIMCNVSESVRRSVTFPLFTPDTHLQSASEDDDDDGDEEVIE